MKQNTCENLICRHLTAEEIIDIYANTAVRHFPPAEYKPVENVRKYLQNGLYIGYGFFRQNTLTAYALFLILSAKEISSEAQARPAKLLLDYYAVLEEYRNTGVGSAFLQQLRKEITFADGFYIESENPDEAVNEKDRTVRTKRIAFYDRNGAVDTGIRSTLFGVPYRILYLPAADCTVHGKDGFFTELDSIYHTMFSPKVYAEKVKLFSDN